GGVSIEPVSIALPDSASQQPTPISVNGSLVRVTCGPGSVDVEIDRDSGSPPITGQWVRNGLAPAVIHEPPSGGGFSAGPNPVGFTGTIRESSGRITRLVADTFYETNAFGGQEDCFVQGTIERFGG